MRKNIDLSDEAVKALSTYGGMVNWGLNTYNLSTKYKSNKYYK